MGSFVRIADHRCDRCGGYTPNRIITEFEDGLCGGCFTSPGPIQSAKDIRAARLMPAPAPLQIAKRQQPGFLARLRERFGL